MEKNWGSELDSLQSLNSKFLVSENESLDLISYISNRYDPEEESEKFRFLEFFSGGGMARLGLGKNWQCVLANDWDSVKGESYLRNFSKETNFIHGDIFNLSSEKIPDKVDLAWASFPCQDLSLAGKGKGLDGKKSGAFWGFSKLVDALVKENREPEILVLENVVGTLTSHGGKDFEAILQALVQKGYRVGAMVINAALFVPQSRPRLFIVGLKNEHKLNASELKGPESPWHTPALRSAHSSLPPDLKRNWVWWKLPVPSLRTDSIKDIVVRKNPGVDFHTEFETKKILSMMSPINRSRVERAKTSGGFQVGAIYKRTRVENGKKHQRAEVRFDGLSGCLRTPSGGSSRQLLVLVENGKVRTRLLAAREAARLMGVPDTYLLPVSYNQAYHLMGDGLVVPVISWLEKHLLRPLAREVKASQAAAA